MALWYADNQDEEKLYTICYVFNALVIQNVLGVKSFKINSQQIVTIDFIISIDHCNEG